LKIYFTIDELVFGEEKELTKKFKDTIKKQIDQTITKNQKIFEIVNKIKLFNKNSKD